MSPAANIALAPTEETRSKVRGSSFYAALRILPRREREAMYAIYDFCRQVDDIADDPGPGAQERRAALDAWRGDLARLYAGGAPGLCTMLQGPIAEFGLDRADFLAVIDGMQMDVDDTICAPAFATLDLYCDRVASAVGRLSVRVFGMEEVKGRALAHHLGRALQFTNILRDLDEDAAMGRLYLPAEALEAAAIAERTPAAVLAHPGLDVACRWFAAQAHERYAAARALLAARPEGRMKTPALMIEVYGRYLADMERAGWRAPRRRASLSKGALAAIALKVLAFG